MFRVERIRKRVNDRLRFEAVIHGIKLPNETEEVEEAEQELEADQKKALERALVEAQERKLKEMKTSGNRTRHKSQR